MRRNSATIAKYVLYAVLLLSVGHFLTSTTNNEKESEISRIKTRQDRAMQKPAETIYQGDELIHDNTHRDGAVDSHRNMGQPGGHKQWHVGMDMADVEHKDWHNYQMIAEETQRTGPGEQGAAVILPASEEENKTALFKSNGFNAFASDKISLDRALRDIRHPDCKKKKYLAILPNVSIVIPVYEEHWTTLLRTVHSVINRSPAHLIHEIILVDDFSSKVFLKKQLDDHVVHRYNGKVKVIHAAKREGLIRARLLGAKAATGQVLIFLDSHVEANTNWLPPLLEPIAENYRTVVCPFIDMIDHETLSYGAQNEGARGAFDWELLYKQLPRLPEDTKHPAEPFRSPVMAGGLFAISAQWFWELGGYDTGLDIWGGEQYELSFKLWQCGGEMVDAPCSRVGHIFRRYSPFPNPGIGDFVHRNHRRVADVWMDEYAEYLFKRRPQDRDIDPGDLTEQRAIRTKLSCKPFKWFMEEVAFDLTKYYPLIEPENLAGGELRNVGSNLCVDTRFHKEYENFGLETCVKDNPDAGGEQNIALTWYNDLRPNKGSFCFDVVSRLPRAPITLYRCHGMRGNQHFKYNLDTHQIYHVASQQCLDCDMERKDLFMNPCEDLSETQRWKWEHLNMTLVRQGWGS